jgi:hypothetical protein
MKLLDKIKGVHRFQFMFGCPYLGIERNEGEK